MINTKSALLLLASCLTGSTEAFYWNTSSHIPFASSYSLDSSSSCSSTDLTFTVTSQVTLPSPSSSQASSFSSYLYNPSSSINIPSDSSLLSSSLSSSFSTQSSSIPTPWIEGSWTSGVPQWSIYIPEKSYNNFKGFELQSVELSDGFEFDSTKAGLYVSAGKLSNSVLDDSSEDGEISISFGGSTNDDVLTMVVPGELTGSLLSSYYASFNLYIETGSSAKVKREEYEFTLSATVYAPGSSSSVSSSVSSSSSNDEYIDVTATPKATVTDDITTTLTEGATVTRVIASCSHSTCSSYTTTEIVSYSTKSYSGSETVITTYYPLPTSSSEEITTLTAVPTITEVVTSCDNNGSCTVYTTEEIASTYTTTVSGKEIIITTYVPFPSSFASSGAVTVSTTEASPYTTTHSVTSCSNGACSSYLTTELVSSYTSTISGEATVITTYYPISGEPTTTLTIPSTITETITSCSSGSCTTYTTTEICSSYTTTISGQVTVVTKYYPLPSSEATTTLTDTPSTITETITSCSAGSCTTYATTEIVSYYTTTISGKVTVVTTYCPLSSTPATTSAAITTSTAVVQSGSTELSTTTETITSCSNGACKTFATTELVSSYTTTLSGEVTVITTYCPLSDTSEATSSVESTSLGGGSATVVIPTTYLTTVSGVTTLITTYCPETSTSSEADRTLLTVSGSTFTTGLTTIVTTVNDKTTIYTTYCPLTSGSSAEAVLTTSTILTTSAEASTTSTTSAETLTTTNSVEVSTSSSTSSPATPSATSSEEIVPPVTIPGEESTIELFTTTTYSDNIIQGTPEVHTSAYQTTISDVAVTLTTYSTESSASTLSTVMVNSSSSPAVLTLQVSEGGAAGRLPYSSISGLLGFLVGVVMML